MNSQHDVVSFMIWLHETGDFGAAYHLDNDRHIWKRAGCMELFLCEKLDLVQINVLSK